MFKMVCLLVLFGALSVTAAFAKEQWEIPINQISMKELVEQGYEIKSTYNIDFGSGPDVYALLQKGSAVFNCFVVTNSTEKVPDTAYICLELTKPQDHGPKKAVR